MPNAGTPTPAARRAARSPGRARSGAPGGVVSTPPSPPSRFDPRLYQDWARAAKRGGEEADRLCDLLAAHLRAAPYRTLVILDATPHGRCVVLSLENDDPDFHVAHVEPFRV